MRALPVCTACAALILSLSACRSPYATRPAASGEDPILVAARARVPEAQWPAFRAGALRVEAALAQGLPLALPAEGGPEGVEMDRATGLPLDPQLRGAEAAGLRWALEARREACQKAGLLVPRPLPEPPPVGAWRAWDSGERGLVLQHKQSRVQFLFGAEGLAWQLSLSGFPAVRSWRPMAQPPRLVALHEGELWVDWPGNRMAALDRRTGRVARLMPAPAWPEGLLARVRLPQGGTDDVEDDLQESPETRALKALYLDGLEGRADAMLKLGRQLFMRDERLGMAWMLRSAEHGHVDAMAEVGVRLLATHPEQGRAWLRKAIAAGRKDLQPLLDLSPSHA